MSCLRGSLAGPDFADDEISGHAVQALGKLKPQKARTHVEFWLVTPGRGSGRKPKSLGEIK